MKEDRPRTSALFQGGLFDPDGATFQQVPRRALHMWCCEALSRVLASIALIIGLVWLMAAWRDWPLQLLALSALSWPYAAWETRRAIVRWRFAGHFLGDEELWVRGGLSHRYIEVMPYGRIQLCEVSSTLWERKFRLARVSVSTGTRTRTELPLVTQEEANKIREALTDLALQRGVQV